MKQLVRLSAAYMSNGKRISKRKDFTFLVWIHPSLCSFETVFFLFGGEGKCFSSSHGLLSPKPKASCAAPHHDPGSPCKGVSLPKPLVRQEEGGNGGLIVDEDRERREFNFGGTEVARDEAGAPSRPGLGDLKLDIE